MILFSSGIFSSLCSIASEPYSLSCNTVCERSIIAPDIVTNINIRGYYASFTYSIAGQTIGLRGYTTKAGKDSANEKDHTQLDANLNININPVFFTIAFYNQSDKYHPDLQGGIHIDQDNLLSELTIKAGSKLIFD